jgi:hypothetical protein
MKKSTVMLILLEDYEHFFEFSAISACLFYRQVIIDGFLRSPLASSIGK